MGFLIFELVVIRNLSGLLVAGLESASSCRGGGAGDAGSPLAAGQGPGAVGREEIDPVGSERKMLFADDVLGGTGKGSEGSDAGRSLPVLPGSIFNQPDESALGAALQQVSAGPV